MVQLVRRPEHPQGLEEVMIVLTGCFLALAAVVQHAQGGSATELLAASVALVRLAKEFRR